ncbi:putative G-protein coupled receptor CG31760 isoform X4 [Calliopsis andreniformis]|uniref:putative G-protein coupled receptor CG31760 isoform X4 n=1 Tax=Calliopsis andreniformis TaxID=337506 RepID=UPI003FCDDE28
MGKSWLLALFPATITTMTMMAYFTVTAATSTTVSLSSTTTAINDILDTRRVNIEEALDVIEAASTGSLGEDCATTAGFKSLPSVAALDPRRYDTARQKTDMTALMIQNFGTVGAAKHNVLLDALAKSLLMSVKDAVETRVIALNASTGTVINAVWLKRSPGSVGEPTNIESHGFQPGSTPDPNLPWFENAGASTELRSPKFMLSPPIESYRGWWTIPYFSCKSHRWLISYSVNVRPPDARHGIREFLSVDIDISGLEVNQCDASTQNNENEILSNQITSFRGTHKCHNDTTECEYQSPYNVAINSGWAKGAYICKCRKGYYSTNQHRSGFDGVLVEAAWKEMQENISNSYTKVFRCLRCAPGCVTCKGPEPCLATYNWPFRITLLSFSIFCVFGTIVLVAYMYKYRKLKVFKVASPIFLSITLLGCAIMYLEMAAIFPVLDMYSCIATKWTRHLGFCISYTALLMKTWRLFIFPHAGPDIKYLLGFLRTQLSTSVTVFLVFGPKVTRVLRGQGDQWDSRARARGITASFSLNGTDLVPEETTDLIQENEELKEEIQKLAAQIEFMKIVHMEMYNRHIKPKAGGYFSTHGHGHGHLSSAQSPIGKSSTASFILKQTAVERGATEAAAAAVEDSTFPSGSLHRARRMEILRERKAGREREREKEREKERERVKEKEMAKDKEKDERENEKKKEKRKEEGKQEEMQQENTATSGEKV